MTKENQEFLSDIEILCRIYELKQPKYSSKIAEYTNSQNPVTTRDIRSIDSVQQKLESEFLIYDYFYERKKTNMKASQKRNELMQKKRDRH